MNKETRDMQPNKNSLISALVMESVFEKKETIKKGMMFDEYQVESVKHCEMQYGDFREPGVEVVLTSSMQENVVVRCNHSDIRGYGLKFQIDKQEVKNENH